MKFRKIISLLMAFSLFRVDTATAQSFGRFDAVLTDLMVVVSGNNRSRQSYSIILDRFTGQFKICQTGRNSLLPVSPPCFETTAMSPSGQAPIYKLVVYNDSRQAWVGYGSTTLSFEFYMTFFMDTTNGHIWCFQLRGDRNSSGNLNYDIWPMWK